jgi:hypothetical protein
VRKGVADIPGLARAAGPLPYARTLADADAGAVHPALVAAVERVWRGRSVERVARMLGASQEAVALALDAIRDRTPAMPGREAA